MRRHNISDETALLRLLRRDARLRKALVSKLTVNTTAFLRDPDRWQRVVTDILPTLDSLPRMWSAGCSDGSEAYTMAILSLEAGLKPRIVATDIDEASLEAAHQGIYSDKRVAKLPTELRDRYFHASPAGWEVSQEVRKAVSFKHHDLLTETTRLGPFDLIVCRNVAIYLTNPAQMKLHDRLTEELIPGGHLFLGNTEHIPDPARLKLHPVNPFLYQRAS